MNNAELLMSIFPLEYKFEKNMPSKQKGLYIDNIVYLNPNQTDIELHSTVAEEIGHHYTSVGDILDMDKTESRKQERKARFVGSEITMNPSKLIQAYRSGCRESWEVADYLGITVEALFEGLSLFKEKYGESFRYKNYLFHFGQSDSLEIYFYGS